MTELEAVIANSQRLAPTTRRQYRSVVRAFVAFAGRSPRSWTPASVDAWLRLLAVKAVSVNAYLSAIRYASRRWAALTDGARDFAAAAETVLVPIDKHPESPTPLSSDQLGDLLASCGDAADPADLRDRAILAIALHAGFRRAEIAKIEFEDLDHCDRSIVVVAKRNKRHRVRLSASCWQRLAAWLEWLRRRHVPFNKNDRVFRSLRRCLDAELGWCVGSSMAPEAIYGVIRRRARQAGIWMNVSPHSLRHSLVKQLRDRGVPESEIARRVGHADVRTTAGYGGEVLRDIGETDLPT
ncbi:MAG: site-specific integrase [Deltaproteobacteria bacterium]|nr:site-specific integrase [Deltaproteobacteria bacterium]